MGRIERMFDAFHFSTVSTMEEVRMEQIMAQLNMLQAATEGLLDEIATARAVVAEEWLKNEQATSNQVGQHTLAYGIMSREGINRSRFCKVVRQERDNNARGDKPLYQTMQPAGDAISNHAESAENGRRNHHLIG